MTSKELQTAATALAGAALFDPTEAQAAAKAKLYGWLDARRGLVGIETLSQDELSAACGTRRVLEWLKDPEFQLWLFERDVFGLKVQATKEAALAVLRDIALDTSGARGVSPRDQLKALQMLLDLAGAFPTKQKEVRFLDRDLNDMPDHEVERQKADLLKKLGPTNKEVSRDS